jgi:hypothetical protein
MNQKYDDVLLPFLSLMRKELHANSRKGDRPGWLAMGANVGLLEIYWHVAKLSAAVKNNDGPAIMEHSADVANMAMMVLDICGGLGFVEPDPCGVPKVDVSEAMARYLRRCRSGGLTNKQSDLISGAVEDAQRLGYFDVPSDGVTEARK